MSSPAFKSKHYSPFIFGFLFLFFILGYVSTSTRGLSITDEFFDPVRTTSTRNDVAIIGIDDASLQKIGAWPWDRSVFANLTKKISDAGARSIVYDVLFLEPRSGDEVFKNTLNQTTTPIVLASKTEGASYFSSYLVSSSSPKIYSALANVLPDKDGKVRAYSTGSLQGSDCTSSLAFKAFSIAIFSKETNCVNTNRTMFRYPTIIPVYSVIDILSGKVGIEVLKGKTIFIGSTSLDLEDHFVGMSGEKTPGVYVHASIFTSLMNRESDRSLTLNQTLILLAVYLLITGFYVYRTKTLVGQIGVITLVCVSALLISYLAFSNGIELPLPWLIGSTLLMSAYVILVRFIQEQKRSNYIESMFSKYVHKDILRELMQSNSSLHFEGERRDMTILFSDLRGFTTLSESLEPEQLTKLLNAYLTAMTPCILNEKGTIDKFIGDAIMAFWNAPLYVENHSQHAVVSALAMQEALSVFNKKNNASLAMGVGLHRGEVTVGNVGSNDRVNYTVLGDAVNLASRVEGLTKKYGVATIVTEAVRVAITDTSILFRKLDVITVKGKSIPTVLYEAQRQNEATVTIFKEYEKAFTFYQSGDFDQASVLFKKLSDQGDTTSRIMLERIRELKVSDSWDGIWHWDEK